jgi:hypothetical protein
MTEAKKTLVLDCPPGKIAFDQAREALRFRCNSTGKVTTLRTAKYPRLAAKVLTLMLADDRYFLRDGAWKSRKESGYGGNPLSAIVSDIWRLLSNEYQCTETPFSRETGVGTGILLAFLKPSPSWLADGGSDTGVSINAVAEDTAAVDHPNFRWISELTTHVREGTSVRLSVLPGNGADDIYRLLMATFPEAATIRVDLSGIVSANDFLTTLIRSGQTSSFTIVPNQRMSHHEVAKLAVGEKASLIVVVERLGLFARLNGQRKLAELANAIHGFKNVHRPPVVCVLLSPISVHHLLPRRHGGGSLLTHLTHVFPSVDDVEALESWMHDRLSVVPLMDRQRILKFASGQYAAISAVLRVVSRPRPEWVKAVHDAHEAAGGEILAAMGPCCFRVLDERLRDSSCVRILEEAGILRVRANRDISPHVKGWSRAWGEAWRPK